jgi:hypothetical protein
MRRLLFNAWLAWVIGVVGTTVFGTSLASAQQKDIEAAKRHYLAGKDALGKNDVDKAVREFVRAYDLSKDPAMFKQIGAAYEQGGRNMEAAIYYRRYLNEVSTASDADEIRKKIEKLDAPPKAPEPPPAPPPAAATPTPTTGQKSPTPAGTPAAPVLPPSAPPARATPTPPDVTAVKPTPIALTDDTPHGWRTAAWVSVGLTAVAITTGAVLATSAQAREEDIRRLLEFRDPTTGQPRVYTGSVKDDYDNKVSEGQNLNRWSSIAFIGAGVCAAAATTFFILDATSHRKPSDERVVKVTPFVGFGAAGLAGEF